MTDIPRRAVTRSAKLAGLPLGFAGRATIGLGKRLGGRPAEVVAAELQARTAEQLFQVLGQLKGGAMKLGQALSVFEAALPEEIAAPVPRGADQAAGGGAAAAGRDRPRGARRSSSARPGATCSRSSTTGPPPRRASARCTGRSGTTAREVAVKIQYPGAGPALLADLKQLGRLARMFSVLHARARRQAAPRGARGAGHRGARLRPRGRGAGRPSPRRTTATRRSSCPQVVAGTERVLVTEWIEGIAALAGSSATARPSERDRAVAAARPLPALRARCWPGCCTPTRTPATSGCCPTAGSASSTSARSTGCPTAPRSRSAGWRGSALAGEADEVLAGLRDEGFVKGRRRRRRRRAARLPAAAARAGRRTDRSASPGPGCASRPLRIADPRSPAAQLGRQLNLPPSYLLIHRVTLGSIGVLCQLGGDGRLPRRGRALAARLRAPPGG